MNFYLNTPLLPCHIAFGFNNIIFFHLRFKSISFSWYYISILNRVHCFPVKRAKQVWENGDWEESQLVLMSSQPDHESCQRRPNPTTTGQRYFFSSDGKPVRASWPLPDDLMKRNAYDDTSSSGCSKKRFGEIGHRQRAGMWIMVCMTHETIIGFHVMPGAEGKRDFIYPLYKYKRDPPRQVWVDFGCGCSETGLNHIPEYFADVEFFVDAFHSYSHLCPCVFGSKRYPEFKSLNTSIMEQINSFLQPLRGILKSGTTKVNFTTLT